MTSITHRELKVSITNCESFIKIATLANHSSAIHIMGKRQMFGYKKDNSLKRRCKR